MALSEVQTPFYRNTTAAQFTQVFLTFNQHHANHLTPAELEWKPMNHWYNLIGKIWFLRLALINILYPSCRLEIKYFKPIIKILMYVFPGFVFLSGLESRVKQQLGHDRTRQLSSDSQTGSTPLYFGGFWRQRQDYQVLALKHFSNTTSWPPPSSGGGRFGTITEQQGLVKHG